MNKLLAVLRISILCLSFGAMIGYGYALGGLGGYLFGRGKPLVIAAGLAGGTVSALLALKIWRIYLNYSSKEYPEEVEMPGQKECDKTKGEDHPA
jgi:hypothetical protein